VHEWLAMDKEIQQFQDDLMEAVRDMMAKVFQRIVRSLF